ncbi:hypothetical protein IT402_00165 [Candidatus Nomurabacteria bacterium]|nr:hypothetical protein [Candidatus Nomurabacteria bacterium]
MPEIPKTLEYFGRSFKIGDRVKCNVWPKIDTPRKWVAGVIVSFHPTRTKFKGPTRIFFKEGEKRLPDPTKVIISDTEEGEGVIVFDCYRNIRMTIRTDEKITDEPNSLLDGYGWNTSGQHVIFEHEKEYDPYPDVELNELPKDLPF